MYTYYKPINIKNDYVYGSSNHTDFPMLFKTTANWLKTVGNGGKLYNSNGYDFIFRSGPFGSQLDHEIQRYNPTTGEMIAWVKIPTLKYDSITKIYACYGNQDISTSQENVSGVWSNNYTGVWQLKESGNGTSDEFIDSSGNDYHGQGGAGTGSNTPTRTEGNIGYCQSFDGNDFISMGNVLSYGLSDPVTYNCWIKTNDSQAQLLGKVNNSTWKGVWVFIEDGVFGLYMYDASANQLARLGSINIDNNAWHKVTVTYNGNSGISGINIYVDGELDTPSWGANESPGDITNLHPFCLGAADDGASYFYAGLLGHPRVADGIRSADWIKTEYANQNSPNTFYGTGSEFLLTNINYGCNF